MLALLDRSNNEDCVIPEWLAPSLPAVASDTSLARSTVAVAIAHLELHGWLRRDGTKRGQKPGTKFSGRGTTSTRWRLLPNDMPGLACSCPKPERPARGLSKVQIDREPDILDSPIASASLQVKRGAAPRDTRRGEGVTEGTCFECGRPARRACRTCWDHAGLEMSA